MSLFYLIYAIVSHVQIDESISHLKVKYDLKYRKKNQLKLEMSVNCFNKDDRKSFINFWSKS
jgi:hypothetical protein